ncbi:unnamed protein product [Arabidopsis thaliana]|uniref:Uncharacterized protein n=2 Tax=Arabidopsis thaliana TaxID=3702 RepID=A0A5S9XRU9_ARATH|nr:unnamed protein product [Arabidopsis thaliana]
MLLRQMVYNNCGQECMFFSVAVLEKEAMRGGTPLHLKSKIDELIKSLLDLCFCTSYEEDLEIVENNLKHFEENPT